MTPARDIPVARSSPLDVECARAEFPALHQTVHGHPLVYLDNAATTHKPACVIDAVGNFYRRDNSNVHRGVHALSERATEAFERARETCRRFLGAASLREIVFVRGATEAINLVAHSYGQQVLRPGDEVLLTEMEHHANIVPWHIACQRSGAALKVVPVTDAGELRMDEFERLLSPRTRIVGVTHCSNALGTINPVARIVSMAHAVGARVLVDGAQAAAHLAVDMRDLDCDFYVLSGHKLYGPTGIGVLYGKEELLEQMPPYQSGGEMIKYVGFDRVVYNDLPARFEAGTPNIAGAIGLGVAMEFLTGLGLQAVAAHEQSLLTYAIDAVRDIPGFRTIGTAVHKASIISFALGRIHPHDLGTIFDRQGVAIRAGHHCAMPIMRRFGVPATARASFALYNTTSEVDALVAAIHKALEIFR